MEDKGWFGGVVAPIFFVKMKLEIECGMDVSGSFCWDCWARNVEIVCIRSWRFAHDKDTPQKMTDLNGIIFFPYGKMASHSWHMLKHWVGSSTRKSLDMQKILGCPLFPVKQHLQQQRIRPLEKPSRNGYVWRMAALGTVGNCIWKPWNWIQIMPSRPRILGIFFHGNLRGPPQCHPPQEVRPY